MCYGFAKGKHNSKTSATTSHNFWTAIAPWGMRTCYLAAFWGGSKANGEERGIPYDKESRMEWATVDFKIFLASSRIMLAMLNMYPALSYLPPSWKPHENESPPSSIHPPGHRFKSSSTSPFIATKGSLKRPHLPLVTCWKTKKQQQPGTNATFVRLRQRTQKPNPLRETQHMQNRCTKMVYKVKCS